MASWYSSSILDSGLTVLAAPTDSPSATAVLMVKTGSKNEAPRQAGISHFLEHFVFKGTQKYPSAREVMRALDSVGAQHNAATGKEYTCYWVKAGNNRLERAIELIGEIVFRPLLPEKLMDKERGTILQEIAMYEDLPMAKSAKLFEELIFGANTPLGREIIGSKAAVRSLSRKQLVDYRRAQYQPHAVVFAVAGGVKPADVVRLADRCFGRFPDSAPAAAGAAPAAEAKPGAQTRRVDFKKTDQAHLTIGVPAIKRNDSRRYTLAVLATILGGNASSQLFDEIRDKRGLAYYVRADTESYQEGGFLAVRTGVPPSSAAEVGELVADHLAGFKFSRREFSDAKEFLKGQLALSWEESQSIAAHLAEDYLFEAKIRSYGGLIRNISAVTEEQVKILSKHIFAGQKSIYLAAVGPVDKRLKFNAAK